MGSSHSQPKLKANRQVKPFQNGRKSCRRVQRRVLDNKGIQYVHESFAGSHGRDVSILSWWKHLFARLTQPGSIQLYDGTSTPETQNLDSSPENCTYGEDFNSTPSFMINNQQRNAVCGYFSARCKPDQHGLTNFDSHVSRDSDLRNDSSYGDQINGAHYQQYTEIDNNTSSSESLYSSARPHIKPEQKCISTSTCIRDPEPEEISIAQAEVMYSEATWRMYKRITRSRTATAIANQRFCIPNAVPRSDGDGECSPKNNRGSLFQKLPQYHHADYDAKITDGGSCTCSKEELQNDLICCSDLSVDRHHICFEMDQD